MMLQPVKKFNIFLILPIRAYDRVLFNAQLKKLKEYKYIDFYKM
jgi:hypothetical protein